MKKILLLMLTLMALGFAVAPVSAQTDCSAITVTEETSWFEDFEGYTGSGEQPFQCWIPLVSDATYNGPFVYCGWGPSCHSGLNSAEMKGANNLLILPEFSNSITDLRLSFWATATSVSVGTLEVGIITDTTDATTFVSMFTCGAPGPRGSSSGGNGNLMGPFDFNNATETGRIALRYTSNNASQSWNLDDFTVGLIPACLEPTGVVLLNSTYSSADITWNEMDGETYNVVYWTGTDTTTLQNASLTDGVYTLSDLTPNTSYGFLVQLNCTIDGSVVNSLFTVNFTTPNVPVDLPYEQNFETEPENITDFTIHNSGAGWYIGSATGVADPDAPETEVHSLYISADTGNTNSADYYTTTYSYAALDVQFPDDDLEWHLAFDYKVPATTSYSYAYFSVYMMDGTEEVPTSGVPSGSVLLYQSNAVSDWSHADFLLPYVGNTAKKLVFYWYNGSYAYYYTSGEPAAVDNISIYGNTCAQPMELAATDVTDETITLAWEEVGSATSWNLYMKETNSEDDFVMTIVTDTTYTYTNLNPNTLYSFYVEADCGGGDISNQTPTITKKTANVPVELPYSQNFEGDLTEVTEYTIENSGSNGWYIGAATGAANDDETETPHSIYISNDEGVTNSYDNASTSYSYAVLDVNFPEDAVEWHLSFDYKLPLSGSYSWSSSYAFLSVYLMDGNEDIPTSGIPSGIALLNQSNNITDWTHADFILDNVAGSNKRVVFYWYNSEYASYYIDGTTPAAVDNISIEGFSCAQPNNLSASGIGIDEATVSWSEVGSATSWTVYYKAVSDSIYEVTTASDTAVTLYDLSPDTYYQFYVTADCGNEESNPSESFTFKTQCGALTTLPYTTGFEDYINNTFLNTSNYVDCWNRLASDPSHLVYHMNSTTYSHAGSSGCLDFAYTPSCSTIAIMPPFDESIPVNTLMLEFWLVKTGNSGYFEVGVMTDPEDLSSFEVVDTVVSTIIGNNAASYEQHFVSLGDYSGNGQYIAFRVSNAVQCGYRFDDLTVTEIPSCMHPTNLHYTNVGEDNVTLEWTELGTATSWVIAYGPQGVDPDQATTVSAPTNPYTVTDLVNGTIYDFYVKADCESEWEGPISVGAGQYLLGVSGSDTLTTCGAVLYDDGGLSGNYSNNCNFNLVVYPATEGSGLALNGTVNTYGGSVSYSGTLTIYAGVGTDGTVLGTYSGETSVNLAYGGPVTLNFTSGSYAATYYPRPGFEISVNCTNCFPPSDLVVSDVSLNSATLTWEGSADQYDIYLYGPDTTTFTSASTTLVLNNLTASSNYTVVVMTNCGADGTSLPVSASFITPACELTDQCEYTFLLSDSYGDGWNGGYLDVQQNGVTVATVELTSGSSASQTVSLCDNISTSLVWHSGNFGSEVSFTVTGPDETEIYTVSGPSAGTLTTFTTDCGNGPAITDPTVTTDAASNIAQTSATLNGTVNNPDNVTITAQGFEWKLASATAFTTVNVTGAALTYDLSNLTANTQYTYKAFITFNGNTVYGDEVNFTTLEETQLTDPTVTTGAASNIAQTSATLNGTVNNPDNVTITAQGFEWKLASATAFTTVNVTGAALTYDLSNLTANTQYTYKAFITFNGNTVYGDEVNFTTLEETQLTDPTVATNAASAIAQTVATLNATITNPDNVTITAKGFEWKATAGGTYTQIAGTGTGNTFTANLSGLTANTGYTYKAFITFNGQTVYGSEMTFTTLEEVVEPCNVPTNLHTTDIQNHAISIAWDADANVSSWNIQYRPVGGSLTTATATTNAYTITGLNGLTTYEIQVQADCGDGNLSDWTAAITPQTTNVGIEDYLSKSVTLFPNPAKDVVNVQCTMNNVQSVEVIDVYGKVLRTVVETVHAPSLPTRISVSGLANGMYFVRVTTEEGVVTKQFVKR